MAVKTTSWQAAQNLIQIFRCIEDKQKKGMDHKEYIHIVNNKLVIKKEPTEQNIRSFIPLIKKALISVKNHSYRVEESIKKVNASFLKTFRAPWTTSSRKKMISEKICALVEIEKLVSEHHNKSDSIPRKYHPQNKISAKITNQLIDLFNWVNLKVSGIDVPGAAPIEGDLQPKLEDNLLTIKNQIGQLANSDDASKVRSAIIKTIETYEDIQKETWFFQFGKLSYLEKQITALKEMKKATQLCTVYSLSDF